MKTPKHTYSKECYCQNCLEKRLKDDLLTAISRLIRYLEIKYEYEKLAQRILDRHKVFSFSDLRTEQLEKILVNLTKELKASEIKELVGV